MSHIAKAVTTAFIAVLLTLSLSTVSTAHSGSWHEASATSDRNLEVEISWKDTRSGVSVEGIWVHPETPEIINTYRITGYNSNGTLLYSFTTSTIAGDTCLGDPYTEIPNPNELGSIRGDEITVRVQRLVGGQTHDQVEVTAIHGG